MKNIFDEVSYSCSENVTKTYSTSFSLATRLLSKNIRKEYMFVCFLIFSLIVFQGIIGWYMVKSGLINDVTVSHYRLSIHLVTALIIISMIFWLLKNIISKNKKKFFQISINNFPFQIFILMIFIQIIMGIYF